MRFRSVLVLTFCIPASAAMAQTSVISRDDAIRMALNRGALLGVASADTAIAGAALIAARALPNPSLTASYSRDAPHYHVNLNIPLDFPRLRNLRIESSRAGLHAAQLRYEFSRAMIAMAADTAYTRAAAARDRLALSRRNAIDADSLLHMAERRRDAGDASDMDVELARVNAGQQANVAAGDSLTMITAMLDLQSVLGVAADSLEEYPGDSLTVVPPPVAPVGRSLDEIAAGFAVDAATLNARLQHRSVWSQFSVSLGVDELDPVQRGPLPTVGIGMALPLFDRNRGAIAQAEAERARARADLALTSLESRNSLAHATRERENAVSKASRDIGLLASANRVAEMALTGYREGALPLPSVLEAQRTARDVLGQYIDDLAAAWVATAELRVFAIVPTSSAQLP